MAYKAHRHLLQHCGYDVDEAEIARAIGHTTTYNTVIGNSYTASMYVGLAALLDNADDLTDQAIGFLSYGSGSVAEFFGGTVVPGYRAPRSGPSSPRTETRSRTPTPWSRSGWRRRCATWGNSTAGSGRTRTSGNPMPSRCPMASSRRRTIPSARCSRTSTGATSSRVTVSTSESSA